MASNTPNLGLLKVNPATDGDDTFNIERMLNQNWDKVDGAVGQLREDVGNINIPDATLTQKGIVQISSATNSTSETMAATPKAVKAAYDEAAAAKQAGNDRKAEVVAALVAKGIAASTSDTWAQLISKMTAIIVADGDATAADVLAGKKASNKSGQIIGNIPVLTGVRNAAGVAKWGAGDNSLAVYVEKGYQSGGPGGGEIKVSPTLLQQAEPNLQGPNIPVGMSMFGIPGSYTPSMKSFNFAFTSRTLNASGVGVQDVPFPVGVTSMRDAVLNYSCRDANSVVHYVTLSTFFETYLNANGGQAPVRMTVTIDNVNKKLVITNMGSNGVFQDSGTREIKYT